jgi:hypothetical protein
MQKTNHNNGRMTKFVGVAIGVLVLTVITLSIGVGSASARTVYDYVYSGTSMDGTGTAKGPFGSGLGQIAYDKTSETVLVSVANDPAYVSNFSKAGAPVTFAGLGSDTVVAPGALGATILALDESETDHHRDFYLTGHNASVLYKFHPDGQEIVGWDDRIDTFTFGTTGVCAVGVDPTGLPWLAGPMGGGPFLVKIRPDGTEFNENGVVGEEVPPYSYFPKGGTKHVFTACGLTFDREGFAYALKDNGFGFSGVPVKIDAATGEEAYALNEEQAQGFAVDTSNDDVFAIQGDVVRQYDSTGATLEEFGAPDAAHLFEGLEAPKGITVDPVSHDVWVSNGREYAGGVRRVERFVRSGPITVPTTTTIEPDYQGTAASLQGVLNPDGIATTDCHFEWGPTQAMATSIPCDQGSNHGGSTDLTVSAPVTGLVKGKAYYYRLSAKNGNERVARSGTRRIIAQEDPAVEQLEVGQVNTDGARFTVTADPGGGDASVHFEWGVLGHGFESSSPAKPLADLLKPETVTALVSGMTPGTTYEYRAVVTNQAGSVPSGTQTLTTFLPDPGIDTCPNSQVRKQTHAALLAYCRAYELVSAANAGGFDVESDVVPGQTPLDAYPRAADRLLYSLHFGVLPEAAGSPTNLGLDPYVAERGPDGWFTRYVGVPSDGMPDQGSFGSPLLAADPELRTFAFGGKDICDPCFADGSTNIPLRLPDGQLTKGMAGSLNPAANPTQKVLKAFSDDGTHFVFGSDAEFDPAGDPAGSIYDRNLITSATQVVSTTTAGVAMSGGQVAELDISDDGARIVVGKLVSTDAKGNEHWHPYLHEGDSPGTVDLAPGTTSGVIYGGMSGDGKAIFFSTPDALIGADGDASVDVYEAFVAQPGTVTLSLVSSRGAAPSNDDSCSPVGSPRSWNAVAGNGKCGALVLAGGAGVSQNGTIYFLSPELLDGPSEGEAGEANLYMKRPGSEPEFVALLDSSAVKPPPPPPLHPLANASLVTGLETPEALTVDQSNGDIYVVERGGGRVSRWQSDGSPKNFTAGPGAGTNRFAIEPGGSGEAQIAVDNASEGPSPLNGRVYVKKAAGTIGVYSTTGEEIGALTGFSGACGMAVDQSSGVLYVGERFGFSIRRFAPISGSAPVSKANYEETSVITFPSQPCHVAADKLGHVYMAAATTGPVRMFEASQFSASPPFFGGPEGVAVSDAGTDMMVDPSTNHLYVDEGPKITQFAAGGASIVQSFGAGEIGSLSRGVAIRASSGHVYATAGSNIVEFGTATAPFQPIDNPAAVHAVEQSGVHSYEDFQLTPDGRYALFGSSVPLTGFLTQGHKEIYRYDAHTDSVKCPSCPASGAVPSTDTTLPKHGSGLADDGRVFFTSRESFVLRDTNEKSDAYEWSDGAAQLISTGVGPSDSGLVTVSADGLNAYFFTRDTLVHEDENGGAVKIYVARENGGFAFDPPSPPCAASDECHGAGTQAAPPPEIMTVRGSGRATEGSGKKCRKGQVKRRGRCVKRSGGRKHPKRQRGKRHRSGGQG